jgi:hypothetical protein
MTSFGSPSIERATATEQRRDRDAHARDLHVEALQNLLRLALHRRLGDPPRQVAHGAARELLAAEEEVGDHVQVVAQGEVLVDGRDPELRGALGPADGDRAPLPEELARVHRMDACDRLDGDRLARAVVADEGRHLAAVRLQRDVGQRLDGAEALADPAQLEERALAVGGRGLGFGGHGVRDRAVG